MRLCLYIFSLAIILSAASCKKDAPEPVVAVPANTNCIGELNLADPPVIGGRQFSISEFEAGIQRALVGQCVGYQYAISYNGVLMKNKSYGYARIPDEGEMAMRPCTRMNIASVSKTITAVAALKLLEQYGISPDTYIEDYLPSSWTIGQGVENITFRDLLTHNTGFQSDNFGPWNTLLYSGLQNMVAAGTGTNMGYLNANFAMFRILIPGILTTDRSLLTESYCNSVYQDYINEFVLNPVGVDNAAFASLISTDRVHVYNFSGGAVSGSGYNPDNDNWDMRAGGSGWCLSAIDLIRFIDGIRYNDAVLSPANRTQMQTTRTVPNLGNTGLGVYPVNTVAGTGYTHNGGIGYGGGQGYTAVIYQFPGGINATLLINSLSTPDKNADAVLLSAFNAAWL